MRAEYIGGEPLEEIAVIATRWEWTAVIDWVLKCGGPNGPASDLVYWLISQGVYDE